MMDNAEWTKRGIDSSRDNRIQLRIGALGSLVRIIYLPVYNLVYYLYLAEIYGGMSGNWERWDYVFRFTNLASFSLLCLVQVGYFGFLRGSGSRFALLAVFISMVPWASSSYIYQAIGIEIGHYLVMAISIGSTLFLAACLWEVRMFAESEKNVRILIALMVISLIIAHVIMYPLSYFFTTTDALSITLFRVPNLVAAVFVNLAALIMFRGQSRALA
jgi:hypothetical protein